MALVRPNVSLHVETWPAYGDSMDTTKWRRKPPAEALSDHRIEFIQAQPMFFVATAAATGTVNVSPKGMDTLRVLGNDRLAWLNLSGSGNETAAHVLASKRMTLMWMSIGTTPVILRVYGQASVVHPRDDSWDELAALFPSYGGSRQIFDLRIDRIADSCGSGVPVMTVEADRGVTELEPFYAAMEPEKLHGFWERKNQESIDGLPTNIFTDP